MITPFMKYTRCLRIGLFSKLLIYALLFTGAMNLYIEITSVRAENFQELIDKTNQLRIKTLSSDQETNSISAPKTKPKPDEIICLENGECRSFNTQWGGLASTMKNACHTYLRVSSDSKRQHLNAKSRKEISDMYLCYGFLLGMQSAFEFDSYLRAKNDDASGTVCFKKNSQFNGYKVSSLANYFIEYLDKHPKYHSESSTKVFYKMLEDKGQICKEE